MAMRYPHDKEFPELTAKQADFFRAWEKKRAEKGGDPADVVADRRDFGDLGRGGIRLHAALCALELLLPGEPASA